MMNGLSRFIILISEACDDFMEFSSQDRHFIGRKHGTKTRIRYIP